MPELYYVSYFSNYTYRNNEFVVVLPHIYFKERSFLVYPKATQIQTEKNRNAEVLSVKSLCLLNADYRMFKVDILVEYVIFKLGFMLGFLWYLIAGMCFMTYVNTI